MKKYDIGAYVWPAYTGDEPRTRIFWNDGIGEWQTVKSANAKFEGHSWPRKPLWGYQNEADPSVMEMQIDEATKHGVNVFIYDWYWYDDRPFLENCLNDGFLRAKNNHKMKFYLMWANHDANHLWSKSLSSTEVGDEVIWKGSVSLDEFRNIYKRVTEKYFSKENYYKIEGKPVFMIYDLYTLLDGLGGIEGTKKALNEFREYVKEKGFDGLHLQLTGRGEDIPNISGVDTKIESGFNEVMEALGIDSFTHYQFIHFTDIDRDYNDIVDDVVDCWKRIDKGVKLPYYPHISCGWDNNPRFEKFRAGIVKNNTPKNFENALIKAKEYVDKHSLKAPLITINSWNEWTETSYLEPDDLNGYGYLEAIKRVFLDE